MTEHVAEQLDGSRYALSPLAKFRIRADVSAPSYEVNGQDISANVRHAALLLGPNDVPVLQLELRGAGDIEGAGVVKVILDDAQAEIPLGQAVLRFLDSIDPGDLEQRVMMSGMNDGPVQAVLRAVRELALS